MNLKRVRCIGKGKRINGSTPEYDKLISNNQGIVYQCGVCYRIVIVSKRGINGIAPAQGWHEHMDKCNSHYMIMYTPEYFMINGYKAEFHYCAKYDNNIRKRRNRSASNQNR